MPVPPAELRPWRPGTADIDDWRDTPPFAPVGADTLVMALDPEPQDAQAFYRAAGQAGIAGRLLEGDTRFEGYGWYDALARVRNVTTDISEGGVTHPLDALRVAADPSSDSTTASGFLDTLARPEAIHMHLNIVRGDGPPETMTIPADLAFVGEGWTWVAEAQPLVTRESDLNPAELKQLLRASFFAPSDDADSDSWESQRTRFDEEAMHLAVMDGTKHILVFSMAGGTGRSYHADLGCANTARRIHYLLEPGWRADQAIQGLGRTHRTHQASAPLFRPVATDVKGERRFIASIARRLDSLGAITRGQRDSQTAMGGDDTTLFRASDNLESLYAKSALRQFYIALWRGHIEGWSLVDFEDATGLKLTWEGNLKEDLPPMPQFLNRLLALPIAEQNVLFAALETRIEANIEHAVEAGTFERGVETITADSLSAASREPVFVHEGSGAETEIVEVVRRDRLEPLTADGALAMHTATSGTKPRLMVNAQSKRAALVLPAPSRMFDDGGVQERVRLVRPASRDTMARAALDASQWRAADDAQWRAFWDAEIAGLPSHRESRFWLVAGLLLPIWDRLPDESMRVRRLVTDDGQHLIGRVLGPAEATDFRAAFGLDGGPGLTAAEVHDEIMVRGASFPLANGWRLARRRLMGADRIEIEGPSDGDTDALKRMGCIAEIVSWRTRLFTPDRATLERIIERWPVAAPSAA